MAGNLDLLASALEAADRVRGYKASYSDTSPLTISAQGQRDRLSYADYRSPPTPPLRRRDSSASSARSMIDDRMRMADWQRGRSPCGSPVGSVSPFRSGSPFQHEYAALVEPPVDSTYPKYYTPYHGADWDYSVNFEAYFAPKKIMTECQDDCQETDDHHPQSGDNWRHGSRLDEMAFRMQRGKDWCECCRWDACMVCHGTFSLLASALFSRVELIVTADDSKTPRYVDTWVRAAVLELRHSRGPPHTSM